MLTQDQGGACIAKTKSYYVIGTWSAKCKMENGVAQNPGTLNGRVETLANDLVEKGS